MVLNNATYCERITSDECVFVADKLGLPFQYLDDTDYPPYCSVYAGTNAFFNNNTASTYDCDYEGICVCEKWDGDAPAPGHWVKPL